MSEARPPKLPNFFLAGAPASGTTSLHQYLRQHPQVYMSSIKEPTFFAAADMLGRNAFLRIIARDRTALRRYLEGEQGQGARYWVTEWNDYVALFRNAREQIAIGEASVSYFWLPSAAPAIKSKLPDARLIFLLRNPADRLFSWYLMKLERHPGLTFRDWFLEARDAGGDGGPTDDRHTLPLDGGWCVPHLLRFLEHFPREQVRIYLYESLHADAPRVLRDMFEFLGVDPDQRIDMSRRHNETVLPRFPGLHRIRRRLFGDTSVIWWLPTAARNALGKLYHRRRGALAIDPDDRRLVIDHYRDDILGTADIIGRDLSAWLR